MRSDMRHDQARIQHISQSREPRVEPCSGAWQTAVQSERRVSEMRRIFGIEGLLHIVVQVLSQLPKPSGRAPHFGTDTLVELNWYQGTLQTVPSVRAILVVARNVNVQQRTPSVAGVPSTSVSDFEAISFKVWCHAPIAVILHESTDGAVWIAAPNIANLHVPMPCNLMSFELLGWHGVLGYVCLARLLLRF